MKCLTALLSFTIVACAPATATDGVGIVYLVPSDRTERPGFVDTVTRALEALQAWTSTQAGGQTFELSRPLVQVVHSQHPADWYGTHANGDDPASHFQKNIEDEVFAALRIDFGTARRVEVTYVDADPPCGAKYGGAWNSGGAGISVLPANDLRGLIGETTVQICGGGSETQYGVCRWVGGLGHELGHALGLPHPPGCDQQLDTCDAAALMGGGFLTFPDTYWRADDLALLRKNPLFGARDDADPNASCH